MYNSKRVACAIAACMPLAVHATEDVDEIIVEGKTLSAEIAELELGQRMIYDSASVLKAIPGANVNRNGGLTGIAQYRGMYGDRVTVALDNHCFVSGGPNAMDSPLSYSSAMMTESISVERGISSISSAPESIGGMINASIARGDFSDDGFDVSGQFGTRYSDNGYVSSSLGRMTLANENHRVSMVATLDDSKDVATPVGTSRPSRMDRSRYDLSYAFRNGEQQITVFAGRLDTTDTGTPALPMDIRYIETDLFGFDYTQPISNNSNIEARVSYNDVAHVMDNFGLRQAPMPMRHRETLATGSGTSMTLASVTEFEQSLLKVGVDAVLTEHDAHISNPNNAMFEIANFNAVQRDVYSAFAEWNRQFRRSELELGARYRRVEASAGEVGASGMMGMMGSNVAQLANAFNNADRNVDHSDTDLVAKYTIEQSDTLAWRFEIGSKSRAPSYQETFLWLPMQSTGGLADGRTYIGDLDLRSERSHEINIGSEWSLGRFELSPQIYFKRIDDYIQGAPSSHMLANSVSSMMNGQPALQFSNVDAEIWGMDLGWHWQLSSAVSIDGIASYSRGRRTDIDDNLYRLAPLNGNIGLNFSHEAWMLRTEVVASSRQDKVSLYNDEQETPGYGIANVSLMWHPMPNVRIESGIENLFDKTYQDHVSGINRAMGSDIPAGVRLFGAERTVSVGVAVIF